MTRPTIRFCTAALAALMLAAPASAQPDWDREQFPEKLEEMFRSFMDQARPMMEDMFDLMEVLEQIDDPTNYGKPRILPNGDILIPRAEDAPDWQPEGKDRKYEPAPAPAPVPDIPLDPENATRI